MDIVFIGCVESSKAFLEALLECKIENVRVTGVVTKKESNYNSDFCDLNGICNRYSIDYLYTNDINNIETIRYIKNKNPDLIYCFGWSQLLCNDIIDIPCKGVVGFHPSELPKNRGRHPIIWALVLGLQKTASTFFMIDKSVDSGEIISQKIIEISHSDDARTLYNKIIEIGRIQVVDITRKFLENTIIKIEQEDKNSNTWRKRNKADGKIDWRMNSKTIYNLIRGLARPYPGAYFMYENNEYKVWSSEIIETNLYSNIECGKVINVFNDNAFSVKTGDGIIKIKECDYIKLKEGEYLL